MATYRITVNGRVHEVEAPPDMPLLYLLRNDLQLNGPRFGCGLAQCGACTVLIGGAAMRSCTTRVASVGDAPVVTLEGLGSPEKPHALQKAFVDEQAAQCGYCTNGMIMQAVALLARKPEASEADIRDGLAGNLCRCGTHVRIVKAIRRAAVDMSGAKP